MTVYDFGPGRALFPKYISLEVLDEIGIWGFGNIGNFTRNLTLMTHAPYASVGFVSIRVVSVYLIVRYDLVIPVNNIHTAIGSELDINGAEPVILTFEKVW